jgi:hypothetical protein
VSPASQPSLFRSFLLGGFECSTHRRRDGLRLDLIAATRHDLLAEEDYRQLAEHGTHAARDGARRPVPAPLARELRRQQTESAALFSPAAAEASA